MYLLRRLEFNMGALRPRVKKEVLVMGSLLEGVGAECVADHIVLVEGLELVQILGDGRRLAVSARPRDGVEDGGRGQEAGEDVESGLLLSGVS